MRGFVLAGVVLGVLSTSAPAGAAVVHVNCANANLQSKMNSAAPGSTLEIKGTCKGQFMIPKSLKLVGDPSATIDGNLAGRPLNITGPNVLLSHLVIKRGRLTGTCASVLIGGGILAINSNLTLRHVKVTGNKAEATGGPADFCQALGGGIFSDQGSLTLIDSTVTGNVARASAGQVQAFGGGIYRALSEMTLTRTIVSNNRAVGASQGQDSLVQGGGIFDDEGHVALQSSHVDANKALSTGPAGGTHAQGGGIFFSDGESFFAVRSTVNGNRATSTTSGTSAVADGGGLAGFVTHGTLSKSKLSSNVARAESTQDASSAGGGASVQTLEGLTLVSARVASNQAVVAGPGGTGATGGGLDSPAGTLELRQSTVNGNSSQGPSTGSASGGGISSAGDLVLKASTVSRNVADAGGTIGGGIVLAGTGTGSITNSTIASNQVIGTTARGGGIDTFRDLTLTSSTVAGNSAKLGGGIYKEVNTTTLQTTILAANTATSSGPNCEGGPVDSAGRNLIASTTGCIFNADLTDKLSMAAKLGTLGDHGGPTQTIPIQSTSPAKNAVPLAACQVSKDQRGVKRPQGPRCDIGAFEVKQ